LARLLFRDTQVGCVDVVLQGAPGGRMLSSELSQSGSIKVTRAIRLMGGLLGALAQAHHNGMVHGGLTPEAIWLARPGLKDERAILLGFWEPLWSALGWWEESMDARVPYMAPEQFGIDGVCAQTDVYQAALMLMEMVSGVEAGGWREDGGHLDLPEAIAGGPLASAVLGALCRAPEDRYRDAGVFRNALERTMIS
jgi:serine/threonine protein kinase